MKKHKWTNENTEGKLMIEWKIWELMKKEKSRSQQKNKKLKQTKRKRTRDRKKN